MGMHIRTERRLGFYARGCLSPKNGKVTIVEIPGTTQTRGIRIMKMAKRGALPHFISANAMCISVDMIQMRPDSLEVT